MSSARTTALALALLALGSAAPAAEAQRDAGPSARRRAAERARGRDLFRAPPSRPASDPERVVEMLREAYARQPHPMLLFNLAMAQQALRRWCDAADTFARYLDRHAGYRADVTSRARRHRAEALRRGHCRPSGPPSLR